MLIHTTPFILYANTLKGVYMMVKRFFSGILVMVFFIATAAFVCAEGQQEAEAAGEIELKVWINPSDSYIGPEEKKLPRDQWYISQSFARFTDENPSVKSIELSVPADQEAAHQKFKVAARAGNAPDICNLWTGQPIFALKDVLLDITDMVPEKDLENISGWRALRYNFEPDGAILGYPASQNQLTLLLYNKSIIRKAGLDFDNNPPETWDEFDAACEKIKAQGTTPIVTDESFPWFFAWIGDYWWGQVTGTDSILAETRGEKKFANDQGFLDALEYYRSLYVNGYFNKDMGTSENSWNRFLQGRAAMTPVVTSFYSDAKNTLGDDLGILMPPEAPNAQITNSTIGGAGQSLVAPNHTEYPEMVVKLMSFLNSKDEVKRYQEIMKVPPVRTDLTIEELGWSEDSEFVKVFPYTKSYIYWIDNLLPSDVAEVYYKETPLVALGKMTPMELAKKMDKNVE
jgi:ABC-type glycerol-3-phosphate transport system substrate-binding protein